MGDTAEGPSGQIVVWRGGHVMSGLMLSHTSRSMSTSLARPWPPRIRSRIVASQPVPSRQGVHLPHDSWAKKRTTRWQARTMSVVSSITMMAPEPSIDPAPPTAPASSGRSRCSSKNQGADAPPGMNALSLRPDRMPPQ
jgi:hypothetical protein